MHPRLASIHIIERSANVFPLFLRMGDHKECMRSHSNWQQRWPVVTIAVSLDGVGQEGQDVATLLTAGGDVGQERSRSICAQRVAS